MKREALLEILQALPVGTEILIPCEHYQEGVVRTTEQFKARVLTNSVDQVLLVPGEGPWSEKEFQAVGGRLP